MGDAVIAGTRAHADACGTGQLHTQSRLRRVDAAAAELRASGA